MAYVAMTFRGGSERARDRARQALNWYFEDSWGEVVVELSHDGSRWHVDMAWSRPPGASPPRPGETWDCRDRVANALALKVFPDA